MKCTFDIQILLLQNFTQLNVFKMYSKCIPQTKCIQNAFKQKSSIEYVMGERITLWTTEFMQNND